VLLLGAAALLSFAAALAIAVLLFGDFGSTEGRILGTTAVLAGYALLALPAAMLYDRGRLPALVGIVSALAAVGAALVISLIWSTEPPDTLAEAAATVNAWLIAAVQAAALSLRRQPRDSTAVSRLFVISTALAVTLAGALTVVIWAEIDSSRLGRVLGSLLVLDVLLVALQPILARARPVLATHRVSIELSSGEAVVLEIEAMDTASAAARAIRAVAPQEVARLSFERRRPVGATNERARPAVDAVTSAANGR
jgi:hypothetical protein